MADNNSVLGQEPIVPQEINANPIQDKQTLDLKSNLDRIQQLSAMRNPSRTVELPVSSEKMDRRLGRFAPVEGVDIMENLAQDQTVGQRALYFLPRVAVKIGTEVANIPGYTGGMVKWLTTGFDPAEYGNSFNNFWTTAVTRFNENITQNGLPVYTPESVRDGDIWTKLSSASFWSTEGADGVGFLVAMMVPGAITRWAKVGERLAGVPGMYNKFTAAEKLGKPSLELTESLLKSQKLAGKINDYTAAGVNTVFESAVEGVDAYNGYLEQNPGDIEGAGRAGRNTFIANNAILLGPNILNQKWLFSSTKKANTVKNAFGKSRLDTRMDELITETGDIVDKVKPVSLISKIGSKAIGAAKGIGSEGLWEEGMQYVVSQRAKKGESTINPVENVRDWVENVTAGAENTEFWSGVVIGGIMGGGMSIAGDIRQDKGINKAVSAYHNILKKNSINYLKKEKDFAVVVDGKEQFESDGSYKLDPQKVKAGGVVAYRNSIMRDLATKALKDGDEEGANAAMEFIHFNYLLDYLTIDNGAELAKRHIKFMAKQEKDNLDKEVGANTTTIDDIEKSLLAKVDKFSQIYEQVDDTHGINFNVKYDKVNKDAFNEYSDEVKHGKLSAKVQLRYAYDRINALRDELASHKKGGVTSTETKIGENLSKSLKQSFSEIQKTANFDKLEKVDIEDKIKHIEDLSMIYTEAENALNDLYDKKLLQEGFDEKVKEKKELIKEAETAKVSKDITDPELRKIFERNIEIEDLSKEGRQINIMEKGEVKPIQIPGQAISMVHRGRLKITYQDGDGNNKTVYAVVGGKTTRGTIALRIVDKNNNPIRSGRQSVDYLNSIEELVINGNSTDQSIAGGKAGKYRIIGPIIQDRTPAQSRELIEDDAAVLSLKTIVDDYTKLISYRRDRIEASGIKIKKLTELIRAYTDVYTKDILVQKNIKALYKDGLISEDIITKKEALAVAKTYKTVADIQTEIDSLLEGNKELAATIKSYTARKNEQKDKLKRVKAGEEYTLASLQTLYNGFEQAEQDALSLKVLAQDTIASAQKTIKNTLRALKGYNTMISKIIGEDMKDIDLSDEALQIEHLPEDERDDVRNQIIIHFFQKYDKELTEEDANAVYAQVKIKRTLEEKLATAEQLLRDSEESYKENNILQHRNTQLKRLIGKERERLFSAYKSQVQKFFSKSDYIEEDLVEGKDRPTIEDDLRVAFQMDNLPGQREEHNLHVFHDWKSYIHATSNQDYAKTNREVARWFVFVNNIAHNSTENRKDQPHAFMTLTYDQVAKSKNATLKKQVKFYVGNEKSYTYDELKEKDDLTLIDNAKDDIKVVVVNYKNPSLSAPLLVTKDGKLSTKKEKGSFVVYTSLPLATEKRDTKEAQKSGGERFSYQALENAYREANPEATAEEVLKHVKDSKDAALIEYAGFREKLKKEPIVLNIQNINAGKKNTKDAKEIEVAEAMPDFASRLYHTKFYTSTPFKKDDGENDKVDLTVSNKVYKAQRGFTYWYNQNNLELVKPKTLSETKSVDNIVNLLRYVAAKKEEHSNVLAYLNQVLYLTSAEDFKYRLDFMGPIHEIGGKKVLTDYTKLIFGSSSISIDELVKNVNTEDLRKFLEDKFWNFNKQLFESSEFTEYTANRDLELKRIVWGNEEDSKNKNVIKRKGTYKHFLFSTDKNESKGTVWMKPAPKGSNKEYLLALDAQYHNQSLQLSIRGESAVQDAPGPILKANRASYLLRVDIKYADGDSGLKRVIYYPDNKSFQISHDKINEKDKFKEDSNILLVAKKFFETRGHDFSTSSLTIDSKEVIPDATNSVVITLTSEGELLPEVKPKDEVVETKDSGTGLTEQTPITGLSLNDKTIIDAYSATGLREGFESKAKEDLEFFGIEITDESLAQKTNELILEDSKKRSRSRLATKIEGYEREDLDSVIAWFKEHFPEFDLVTVKGLIADKAWGRLVDGTHVLLSASAEKGTIYHEAFHVWNNIYNSGKHKQALYDEVRKRLGNKEMTDDQAEEFLAEEFRDYVMQGSAYVFNKGEETKKGFFTWLLDQIKKFFGITSNNEIENAFRTIDRSSFRMPISETNKTFDSLAKLSPSANLAITKDINYMFFKKLMEETNSGSDVIFNLEQRPDEIYKDLQLTYTLQALDSKNTGNAMEQQILNSIVDNWDKVVAAHKIFLTQYKLDIREDIDEDEIASRNMQDGKYQNNRPMKDYAPLPIRLLIAGLPSVDSLGKKTSSEFYTYSNVDYNKTMDLLYKKLSRVTTVQGMLNEILTLSKDKPELNNLYTWLGGDIAPMELSNTQFKLLMQFFPTFSSNQVDPFFITIHNDGIMTHSSLIDETDKRELHKGWRENAVRKTDNRTSNYFTHRNNNYYVNKDVILKDLESYAKNNKIILSKLGIILNGPYDEVVGKYLQTLKEQLGRINKEGIDITLSDLYNRNVVENQSEMDALAKYASEFTLNDSNLMYINMNGNVEWSIMRNHHVSEVINRLNEYSKDLKGVDEPVVPESLKSIMPYDGDSGSLFNLHSKWWNLITDGTGNNKIRLHLIKGIKDQSDSGTELDESTFGDAKSVSFNSILNNIIPLLRAADRGTEYAPYIIPTNYNVDKEIFAADMFGYLYDEVITSMAMQMKLSKFGYGLKNYTKNAKDLRSFTFIFDEKYAKGEKIETVEEFLSNKLRKKKDFKSLQEYTQEYIDKNRTELLVVFNNYINSLIDNNKESLIESKLIQPAGDNKWYTPGINPGIITGKGLFAMIRDGADRVTDDQLDRILTVHAYNYFVGVQEQLKLFFGDLASYNSPSAVNKRTTSSVSTRQQSVNTQKYLDRIDRDYPKINGRKTNTNIRQIIVPEIKVSSENKKLIAISPKYASISVMDGQIKSTLDFLRGFYNRNGKWTDGQEKTYQYEMQGLVLRLLEDKKSDNPKFADIWNVDESMWTDENGVFYKHTRNEGEMPVVPVFKGKPIVLDKTLEPIQSIKTLGAGYLQNINSSVENIDKMSVAGMFPSTLDDQSLRVYLSMIANDIDSIGDTSTKKGDSYPNDIDFTNDIITVDHVTTEQSYDDYGVQIEIKEEDESRVKDSTQKNSVIFNNMKNAGVTLKQFEHMDAEMDESVAIQVALYNRNSQGVIDELGIELDPNTNSFILPDGNVKAFANRLKKLFLQRTMSLNTIDGLDIWLKSKSKTLELLTDSVKIEQVLIALMKNNAISRKMHGKMLVQESSYLYGEKLNFYDLVDDKVTMMEVMVPVPTGWMGWVNKIGGIEELNRRLESGQLDEGITTFIANRIPTTDINTIEATKIKKFLPHYVGDKIVLPHEIVVKTSSDFDWDKLTSYLNSAKMTKEGPVAVKYLDKSNSTVQERYVEYIRNESVDDPLLDAIDSLFEDSVLTPKPFISFEEFSKLPIIEQNTSNALHNRLNAIHTKALLLPERFKQFVGPHTGEMYKELAEKYYKPRTKLELVEAREVETWPIVTQWWYNQKRGQEFWQGIQGVPQGASQMTVNSGLQHYPISIESEVLNLTNEGIVNGLLFFDGQQLPAKSRYSSGFIKDHDGKDTTDNYSQASVSFVDVAKEGGNMMKLNIAAKQFPLVSFLNRNGYEAGVGVEQIVAFMSSPIIKDYLTRMQHYYSKTLQHNEYRNSEGGSNWFVKNIGYPSNIIDDLINEQLKQSKSLYNMPKNSKEMAFKAIEDYYYATTPEEQVEALKTLVNRLTSYKYRYLTIEDLSKAKMSPKLAIQVLDNFLMYEIFSTKNSALNSSLRTYSSAVFPKSINGILAKIDKLNKVRNDGFFSKEDIDRHIENTVLNGSNKVYESTANMFNWAYLLRKYPKLESLFNAGFIRVYSGQRMKAKDIDKILDSAKGSFISFLYSFNKGKDAKDIRSEYRSMFVGDNSMARRLAKIKNKISNELLTALRSVPVEYDPISGKNKQNDYITAVRTRNVSEDDTMVYIFEELYKSKDAEVRQFANDLFKYSIYQNGMNSSAISFIRVIPNSILIPVMDDLITKLNEDLGFDSDQIVPYFNSFIHQFYRNNARNRTMIPRNRKAITDISDPVVVKKTNRIAKGEYISVRLNQITYAEKQNNKRNKKRNPYTILLYRKTDVTKDDKSYIYTPVGKLGDNDKFQEYYPTLFGDTVTSIIDNNNPDVYKKKIVQSDRIESQSNIRFTTSKLSGYPARTKANASADATIALAINFNSGGEKLTKKSVIEQGKKYIPIDILKGKSVTPILINGLVNRLNSIDKDIITLNIAGNSLVTMKSYMTQSQMDEFMFNLLNGVIEHPSFKKKISNVRSGGQTGWDEAGAKASSRLGIPTEVHTTSDWAFRDLTYLTTQEDIRDESRFKARFNNTTKNDSGLSDIDKQFYQLEDIENEKAPNDDLDNAMRDFFTASGISYKAADTLKRITGTQNTAIAVANITKMTVDVLDGKRNIKTLPEEAAHFYIATLDENDGFYQKMFNDISNYPVYSRVREKYKNIENYSDKYMREEAMAKLIADRLTGNLNSSEITDRQNRQVENWLTKLWAHIRRLFDASKTDLYSKAAYEIFIKSVDGYRISKQNVESIKEEIDPVTAWNNLSMTPHGIYKYDYKRTNESAISSYAMYSDLFGEDNVTLIETSDSNYKAKIAIKRPQSINERDTLTKDVIAQNNVKEMSTAPVGYDSSSLLVNFEKYFPDLGYLEESEKINMLRAIEDGETDLVCEF